MQDEVRQMRGLLKKVFGFESFRPLQEEIIRDALSGLDVFAVLPTGGGKSLCFQLPSLLRPGLTVVVSPLIALMKDQVDALQSAGVAATFLNSSLAVGESRPIFAGLNKGEYRLLYVSPERLLMSGFMEDLKRWKVSLFAIDEAHCISEWGHDFRPEYRQISTLREKFPGVPVMALTATATERVRGDIVHQLNLNTPRCYVASFNRPNLTYRVAAKAGAYEQILSYVRSRKGEAGIIYVLSRKSAEDLAKKLSADGIKARPYHAGMDPADRSKNQEAFLRDEVRLICATIAFGMGINKPNVRFVIHYDLPKNIEGYYQETGRAGRDGLPGECLLMFSPGDRMKQVRFIEEKPSPEERALALAQLEQMIHYAESSTCRRQFLLNYFGETFDEPNCGGCDNCTTPRQTWDGTVAAQKFLSCIHRVRERSGFSMGIQHIVEILCGADTEKIRKFGHHEISTYNIGNEHSRTEWSAIGRELVRLGLIRQNADGFHVVEITEAGRAFLKAKEKVTLTKPVAPSGTSKRRAGEIECDELLFEKLRNLRKELADAANVPSYIVFSDVSLRQMARYYPASASAFSRISGVGEKKLREFGDAFLAEIASHLRSNSRLQFAGVPAFQAEMPVRVGSSGLTDTVRDTLVLFRKGRGVEDIASFRGVKESTIYSHLEEAILAGETLDVDRLVNSSIQKEICTELAKHPGGALGPVHEALGGKHSYGHIRICRALMNHA